MAGHPAVGHELLEPGPGVVCFADPVLRR
ncbi:MAG: hypothetical protein JWN41_1729, partial [Thermoleophilia bacterium]|nr:hypothetical protein [Thermoleophilia bacterium]